MRKYSIFYSGSPGELGLHWKWLWVFLCVFCFVLFEINPVLISNLHEKAITETASQQIIFEDAVFISWDQKKVRIFFCRLILVRNQMAFSRQQSFQMLRELCVFSRDRVGTSAFAHEVVAATPREGEDGEGRAKSKNRCSILRTFLLAPFMSIVQIPCHSLM